MVDESDTVMTKKDKIKILVITSRYPPYHFGGYEIRCNDIMHQLQNRGYEIEVITSKNENGSEVNQRIQKYRIFRTLQLRIYKNSRIDSLTRSAYGYPVGMVLTLIRETYYDLQDLRFIDQKIKQMKPDVIYLGHITNLSRGILPYLSGSKLPIVFDEGGSGLIDSWTEKGIWYLLIEKSNLYNKWLGYFLAGTVKIICNYSKGLLKPAWSWPEKLIVYFNSNLNRNNAINKNVPLGSSTVIHSGIDTDRFYISRKNKKKNLITILTPGRIEPRKGQLDSIRLVKELSRSIEDVELYLIGEKWSSSYMNKIQVEIEDGNLNNKVNVWPMIGHDQMVDMYQRASFCFFPSYYKTGFSRVPMESMACGCIIVSYGNEGSSEIIENRKDGILISEGNYHQAAETIRRMIFNTNVMGKIRQNARLKIAREYSMSSYIDRIENQIQMALNLN